MITASTDIENQVRNILTSSEGEYDIAAIAADLIAAYDLCGQLPTQTIESIDAADFWAIVAEHAADTDQ